MSGKLTVPGYLNAHLIGGRNPLYDGNELQLYRREGGKIVTKRVQAEYVSFHRVEEVTKDLDRALRGSSFVKGTRREGDWYRVVWANRQARELACSDSASPLVQAGIESFEADVDPVLRWLVDSGAPVEKPRRVYIDIETDSRVPFSRKEEMRVLSWGLTDDDGNMVVDVLKEESDGAERDLLGRLWEAVGPYDQALAWNGENFDQPVLKARTDHVGVKLGEFNRLLWVDHLAIFKRMNMHSAESAEEKTSMRLEDIGQAVVGEGKEKTPPEVVVAYGDKSMGALSYQLWKDDRFRRLLLKYMMKDVDLLRRIEKETGYIDLFQTICEVCGIYGDDRGLNPTRQMDAFAFRVGKERGIKFPTKRYYRGTEKFRGAYVMEPRVLDAAWRKKHGVDGGILRNVHVCDFAGMYPSIILSWNMSPETKVIGAPINGPIAPGTCRVPTTGITFRNDVEGIIPSMLRTMIKMRKFYRDLKATLVPNSPEWHQAGRMSDAYKVFANSLYGVTGSPYSRFFDRHIAESVTQTGVWLLQKVIAEAERRTV